MLGKSAALSSVTAAGQVVSIRGAPVSVAGISVCSWGVVVAVDGCVGAVVRPSAVSGCSVEPVVEGETMEPKRFKNRKRRGFGTPVGDVVEPLDISMATWSLSRLGGRPYLLVSHSKPHPKAPELGQDHLLPCISISMYVRA